MTKKVKRFATGDEIVVTANKPVSDSGMNMQNLDYRLPPTMGGGMGGGMGSVGGSSSRSIVPSPLSIPASSTGPTISPAVIKQPSSTLGQLSGTAAPRGYGLTFRGRFKEGGKVKKKPAATKKMAKGGSAASKRGDGCATKGKTKGRFV